MGREKGLEAEPLLGSTLGWGETVPKASRRSWKPRRCKTLLIFFLPEYKSQTNFVSEMELVKPLSFHAGAGGEGSCGEKP